jgi:AraC-like DNA-binding protein
LWAFPPEVVHGWTGDRDPALVVAVQPSRVPGQMERVGRRLGRELVCDLAPDAATWIEGEAAALLAARQAPGALGILRQERLVLDLCLLVAAGSPDEDPAGDPRARVEAAMAWMSEHLAEGLAEADIAHACAVSPSHLRRLFHQVLGASPRAMLQRLRLERAEALLSGGGLAVGRVAAACGFASEASFSRAFHRLRGVRPGRWRAEGLRANLHPTHVPAIPPG